MIEVEKKFILTREQEQSLIRGAEFLGEKKFTDIYYDDKLFSLTTKDVWLRERGGVFELKLSMNESLDTRISDQYRELDIESDILAYFQTQSISIKNFLTEKSYMPFCAITTIRKKYKKNGFNIDLDIMDFGYAIAEIEVMTGDESKIQEMTKSIIAFAEGHHLDAHGPVRGKVAEYLRINEPKHFQALIGAKVIK